MTETERNKEDNKNQIEINQELGNARTQALTSDGKREGRGGEGGAITKTHYITVRREVRSKDENMLVAQQARKRQEERDRVLRRRETK